MEWRPRVVAACLVAGACAAAAPAAGAATLTLKSVTVDKSGVVDSPHWTYTDQGGTARYAPPDDTSTYSWTMPSSIPDAGASAQMQITSEARTNGVGANTRWYVIMNMKGDLVSGGEVRIDADAESGGKSSDSDSATVTLTGGTGTHVVVVGLQDGPVYTYTYAAEATPTGSCAVTRARASAINEVRVVSVKGDVQFHREGAADEEWLPVCKGSVLKQGDEISTDPDGEVVLAFADNSTVTLRSTTQLKIASFFTEGGVVRTEILLKMGEVAAKVNKSEATKSDFQIKSPTATSAVRGTEFTVFYDPGSRTTTVTTKTGVVAVTSAKAGLPTRLVPAGREVEVTPTAIGKVVGRGKSGLRGGTSRRAALAKVVRIIQRAGTSCSITTARGPGIFAIRPAKRGWTIAYSVVGRSAGKTVWKVLAGKAKPGNALAKRIANGCRA